MTTIPTIAGSSTFVPLAWPEGARCPNLYTTNTGSQSRETHGMLKQPFKTLLETQKLELPRSLQPATKMCLYVPVCMVCLYVCIAI